MSILSSKDLSKLTGVKAGTIRVHVTRGVLQKNKDGFFDTENEINARYIDEQSRKSDNLFTQKTETVTKNEVEKPTGQTASQKIYSDLDLRTKIATAEAKENESELKRIQIDKIAGKLLPVELVEKIFTINIQGVFKTFEGELENIASIYVEVLGGSRTELSEIIGKQREVLAKAIQKAKEDAEHEIEIAVDDYKQVRSRGERK